MAKHYAMLKHTLFFPSYNKYSLRVGDIIGKYSCQHYGYINGFRIVVTAPFDRRDSGVLNFVLLVNEDVVGNVTLDCDGPSAGGGHYISSFHHKNSGISSSVSDFTNVVFAENDTLLVVLQSEAPMSSSPGCIAAEIDVSLFL